MSLIKKSSGKNLYTLEEDIIIVTKRNEGFTVEAISDELDKLGYTRTPESLQYRIGRKLKKANSFAELHKVKKEVVEKALADADALMNPEATEVDETIEATEDK